MFSQIFKRFTTSAKTDKTAKAKKAMLFVDFEHWYYAYKENFDMKPDLENVFSSIRNKYDVEETLVFGDFTRQELRDYIDDLESADATIVNTGETFFQRKKSVTDFVLLDRLYRAAVRADIGTYILLSGDGHFRFVVEYLRELNKEVVIYGVTGSFSRALQSIAATLEELPTEEERYRAYYKMIAAQMAYLSGQAMIIPTFLKTAEQVARRNNVPQDRIVDALKKMLDIGYLYQKEQQIALRYKVRALQANWELMIKDGIWDPNNE